MYKVTILAGRRIILWFGTICLLLHFTHLFGRLYLRFSIFVPRDAIFFVYRAIINRSFCRVISDAFVGRTLIRPYIMFGSMFNRVILRVLCIFERDRICRYFSPLLLTLFRVTITMLLYGFLNALLCIHAIVTILQGEKHFVTQGRLLVAGVRKRYGFVCLVTYVISVRFAQSIMTYR